MEQLRRDLNLDVNATSLDEDEEADFDDDDEECDLMGDFVQTGDGGNELVNEADSGIPDEKVSWVMQCDRYQLFWDPFKSITADKPSVQSISIILKNFR